MCRDFGCVAEFDFPPTEKMRRKATRIVLQRLVREGCHEIRITENSDHRIEVHGKQSATARRLLREKQEWTARAIEAAERLNGLPPSGFARRSA